MKSNLPVGQSSSLSQPLRRPPASVLPNPQNQLAISSGFARAQEGEMTTPQTASSSLTPPPSRPVQDRLCRFGAAIVGGGHSSDFKKAMRSPIWSGSSLNSGMLGWPVRMPSANASSRVSTG